MRYEVKSIGVWALIKITFFLSLALGFLLGLFYAIVIIPIVTAVGGLAGMGGSAFEEMPSVGVLAIILPIMFALFAAVFNSLLVMILAAVYNLIARLLGGMEMHLDLLPETGYSPAAPTTPPAYTPMAPPIAPTGLTPAPPPPGYRPTPPSSVAASVAPQPEMRPETFEETPPAPSEPDEDGPRHDES